MKITRNSSVGLFLIAVTILNLSFSIRVQAQKDSSRFIKIGKFLFEKNCAVCHTIGKGQLTGPNLKGVEFRHTLPWLLKWIHSSQALIEANDREAITVFEVNKKVPMPNQHLNEHEITMVIDYIKSLDKTVPAKIPSESANIGSSVSSPSIASTNAVPSASIGDGDQLFKQNCAACHTIGKGKLVGPDLKGVGDRHPVPWLLKWIHSSQALIKGNDKDAIKIFADNNRMPMPDQLLNQRKHLIVEVGPTTLEPAPTDYESACFAVDY